MIRFVTQWNGYADGTIVDLGGTENARLVAAGIAKLK